MSQPLTTAFTMRWGPLITPLLLAVACFAQDASNDSIPSSLTDPNDFSSTQEFPTTNSTPTTSGGDVSSPTPSPSSTEGVSTSDSGSLTNTASPTNFPSSSDNPFPSQTSIANTPSPSSITDPGAPSPIPSRSSHAGPIAGGVIGALAGLSLLGAIVWFLFRRRLRSMGGRQPPSPRLTNVRVTGGGQGSPRGRRVASADGLSGQGVDDIYGSSTAFPVKFDARHVSSNTTSSFGNVNPAGGVGRHRSNGSKNSFSFLPPDAASTNQHTSYDLSVFRDNFVAPGDLSRNGPPRELAASRQSVPESITTDPFSSDVSIHGAMAAPVGTNAEPLNRNPSVNRLARKPAPVYDGSEDTATAIGSSASASSISHSNTRSKPPVSGVSGRVRANSNANSSRESSQTKILSDPGLNHKASSGTFKFAGEKEGPVHYLIPDMPPSPSR